MPFDPTHPSPRVSIGILTRNAGPLFRQVMDALKSQRTPWPFEVVLLDSASKDGTDSFAAAQGARVVPYKPKKFKFGVARDVLFESCRGEVLVTISQDVVPSTPNWLELLVRPIFEDTADATIGEQAEPPGGYTFYWDYHGSWLRTAIRRATWEKLRFGDVEAIEDRAMQVKLFENGFRMSQVQGALSYHGHDYTWKQLYDRNGSFAMGWAQLGWPYTFGQLLRDLAQPGRYRIVVDAFMRRKLRNWKEFLFPVAMCFIQWHGSRKKQWS
jgi:rhamnosyltransferase